ncbi:hypothetical protein H4582DRAFT_2101758 [Lactarius indigo]|nr:hypothetical protein H4582DRAFT_2101758 [Lactarius indigo]
MPRRSRRRNNSRGVDSDVEAQHQAEGSTSRGVHEMSTLTSGRNGTASGASGSNPPVRQAGRKDWSGSSTQSQVQAQKGGPSNSGDDHQPGDSSTQAPDDTTEPRVIGDFDDSANALWSLHKKEAKSHDEARIQSLKDNMDGVLIFAGLFSAALVSFITDKIHDLQVDPAQQLVYYQQQNVALLAQISNNVSSIASAIAPRASTQSTPPSSYPPFAPTASDVRISTFWFMSLVFSLSAALLATLVQQWVRDYMHVFQRYSNPLKSARLRQYLYEGAEGWYMPVVAESVPGLVHVSLFLFFLGLGDSLLNLNRAVGITIIVLITICGFLYALSTFTPIANPQSPYQNPFSRMIWYLKQKVHPRRFFDRNGALKIVSSNMSDGRAQLAMEENKERQGRDVQAVQWLIDNSTEDDEMESFVMAIPGTFTSKRGIKVWSDISKVKRYEDTIPRSSGPHLTVGPHRNSPLPQHADPPNFLHHFRRNLAANGTSHYRMTMAQSPNDPHTAMYDLCRRVRHLVDTCNNRSQFANDELWRKRSRGCVETVASLVFYTDVELELFGDLGSLLSELGEFEKTHVLSATRYNESFVTRWTYLSLLVVTRGISNHGTIEGNAREAIDRLSRLQVEDDGEQTIHGDTDENALENARRIDNHFETASQFFTRKLYGAIRPGERGLDAVRKALEDHKTGISMLERITRAAHQMEWFDTSLSEVSSIIRSVDHGLNVNLPGVSFDEFKETGLIQPTRFFNLSDDGRQGFTPQFIFLCQRLQLLCSYAHAFRDILDERTDTVHDKILGSLHTLWDNANRGRSIVHQQHLMERQLWRLQDLRDGRGFGFSVELFFLVLPQLLSAASSRDTHSVLYIRTFRDITSDWRNKDSIGTQRVILNLVCDIATPFRGIFSNRDYPEYITNELLVLLQNTVNGQFGSHIDDAMSDLGRPDVDKPFADKAKAVIFHSRAPS